MVQIILRGDPWLPLFVIFFVKKKQNSYNGYINLIILSGKPTHPVMKKTLLILIMSFLWLAVPVKAQLEKGTKYLGGTVSFGGNYNKLSNGEGSKTNQISIQPSFQIGKMTKVNRMIGLEAAASWDFVRFKYDNAGIKVKDGYNRTSYRLSPFVRQYKPINAKWAIFLHASLDLSYLKTKSLAGYGDDVEEGYGVGLKIAPGISYWITPRFALESDINLLSLGVGYQDFLNTKSVNFNSALTTSIPSYFSVRASWYFQKK